MQTILDEFMNIPSAWEKLLGTVRKKRKGLQEEETKQSQTGEVLHHLLTVRGYPYLFLQQSGKTHTISY